MYRLLFLFFLASLVISCNNSSGTPEDALLSQPPYKEITDSIKREPKNDGLYFRRGTLLYSQEQLKLAEKDLRKAWEINPNEEHALRLTTVLKDENMNAAVNFLQEASKKFPNSISLQIGLARGYQMQGKLAEAEAICTKIIQDFPGQLDALTLKSELLQQQGRDNDAITVLERAYVFAPEDVELVHQLAFEYAEAKNPKVLALCDSLIKVDVEQRHAEPYYFKGVYYSNINNPGEAIKQFDLAIRHNYQYMNAYTNKGIVYYDRKQFKEALQVFQLEAKVFPDEADPYYWLGKTQEAMGLKDEARLNYQRAYGLDKTDTASKAAADRLK